MKTLKKLMSLLLALSMTVSLLSTAAFATERNKVNELGITKTAEVIDRYANKYEVSINVPGEDGTELHDEVIIMMDGSYSGDDEWQDAKKAILEIATNVLDGEGKTKLTLMTFGMGDNVVVQGVKTVSELSEALPELPGGLLYGRSSTNCEAGFTGVAEYIEKYSETINRAHVIYISDGEINTDETPRAFDANWQTWTKFGAVAVAQETICGAVDSGENLPAAFTTVFGTRFDEMSKDDIIAAVLNGDVTDKEALAFAEQVWTDVYAYSKLTRGTAYPISDVERAFVKYDKEKGTYIQDLFYYSIYQSSYVTYPDRWTRTSAALDELLENEQVEHLYMVDTNKKTDWMDASGKENATFICYNAAEGWTENIAKDLETLYLTPFNDVVVTDYMSKWVNLDIESLYIVKVEDNGAGEEERIVWTAVGGWTLNEGETAPTAKTPVVVEKVDPADYEAGGADVVGNTSGNIYKLTWNVKDGAMLRADNYRLKYTVTVDTKEAGFQYNTDYPANGNTDLKYTDEYKMEQGPDPIKVPDVDAVDLKYYTGDYYEHGENGDPTTTPLTESQAEKVVEDGAITMNKTIEQIKEYENGYEITLEVVTKQDLREITKPKDAAMVLVMDASGSMQFDISGGGYCTGCGTYKTSPYVSCCGMGWEGTWANPELDKANGTNFGPSRFALMGESVTEFLDDYADTTAAKRWVSMVTYNNKGSVYLDWTDVATNEGLTSAKAKVAPGELEKLSAGDTNTAHAMHVAGLQLASVPADVDEVFVIILTDGAPWNTYRYTAANPNGVFMTGKYDDEFTTLASMRLKANEKAPEVYTVSFGAHSGTFSAGWNIKDDLANHTDNYQVENDEYENRNHTCSIDDLMKSWATDGEHFFRADSGDKLTLDLEAIVETTVGSAEVYTVTDPMGNYIDFVELKTDSEYAKYDEKTETLKWNLLNETPVYDEVAKTYTYTLTYKVDLDVYEEGCTLDTEHPANKATSLTYVLADDPAVIKTAYFNLPSVYASTTGPHDSNAVESAAVMTLSMDAGSADAVSCFLIAEDNTVSAVSTTALDADDASFAIPSEEDSVSAVYVQKADTGMLWTSKKVSNEVLDDLVDAIEDDELCDKHGKDHKNNHNKDKKDNKSKVGAIVSGEGSFELKYREGKKNKHVTYTFEIEDNDQDCSPNCGNKHHGHDKHNGPDNAWQHNDKPNNGKKNQSRK